MDYRHLHLVAEICRHGSFSRAAAALGVSQPALSKNIARLEDQLGVKLFLRGKGATQPTVFAQRILARSKAMLGEAERIAREVRQMATNEAGRVRIGTDPVSRAGFLPHLVPKIVDRFPALGLEVLDRPPADVVSGLLARDIDVGITSADLGKPTADLIEIPLFSSPVVVVANPDHPLFRKGLAGRALDKALCEYPVVLPSPSADLEPICPQDTKHKISARGSVTGPDFDLVKDIVSRTNAITHGPAFLFEGEIAGGSLAFLPIDLARAYTCSMLVTPGAMHSPVIKEIGTIAIACGVELGGTSS